MPDTAAIVAALILERPLCVVCLADKATTTLTKADATLAAIATSRELRRRDHERCRSCGEIRRVFWLDAPTR